MSSLLSFSQFNNSNKKATWVGNEATQSRVIGLAFSSRNVFRIVVFVIDFYNIIPLKGNTILVHQKTQLIITVNFVFKLFQVGKQQNGTTWNMIFSRKYGIFARGSQPKLGTGVSPLIFW